MTAFNVGIITLNILVNSEDVAESAKQIFEQAAMHPTTVEVSMTVGPACNIVTKIVEKGNFKPCDIKSAQTFTRLDNGGNETYHTIIEATA